MYTLYKFHFLNGISEINQLFDDILIILSAPVCVCIYIYIYIYIRFLSHLYDLNCRAHLDEKAHIVSLKKSSVFVG